MALDRAPAQEDNRGTLIRPGMEGLVPGPMLTLMVPIAMVLTVVLISISLWLVIGVFAASAVLFAVLQVRGSSSAPIDYKEYVPRIPGMRIY